MEPQISGQGTVAIIREDGTRAEGNQAVVHRLSAVSSELQTRMAARRFVHIMISALVLVGLFPILQGILSALGPISFGIAAVGTAQACTSCGFATNFLSNAIPIWILLCGAIASLSSLYRDWKPFRLLLAGVAIGSAIGQPILAVIFPKLCFYCIIAGITAWGVALYTLSSSELGLSRPVVPLLPRRAALASGLMVIPFLALFAVTAVEPPTRTSRDDVRADLLGSSLDGRLHGLKQGPCVVLVTLSGCGACDRARASLNVAKVSYIKAQPCTFLDSSEPCFNSDGLDFASPLVLVGDSLHRVVYVFEGWPESTAAAEVVVNEIRRQASKAVIGGRKSQ